MFVIELAVAIVLVWFAANFIFALAAEIWDIGVMTKAVHDAERARAFRREMAQHPQLVEQRRTDLQRRRARRARTIWGIISALSAATIAGWFS
jgi:hypothetical protein